MVVYRADRGMTVPRRVGLGEERICSLRPDASPVPGDAQLSLVSGGCPGRKLAMLQGLAEAVAGSGGGPHPIKILVLIVIVIAVVLAIWFVRHLIRRRPGSGVGDARNGG